MTRPHKKHRFAFKNVRPHHPGVKGLQAWPPANRGFYQDFRQWLRAGDTRSSRTRAPTRMPTPTRSLAPRPERVSRAWDSGDQRALERHRDAIPPLATEVHAVAARDPFLVPPRVRPRAAHRVERAPCGAAWRTGLADSRMASNAHRS